MIKIKSKNMIYRIANRMSPYVWGVSDVNRKKDDPNIIEIRCGRRYLGLLRGRKIEYGKNEIKIEPYLLRGEGITVMHEELLRSVRQNGNSFKHNLVNEVDGIIRGLAQNMRNKPQNYIVYANLK